MIHTVDSSLVIAPARLPAEVWLLAIQMEELEAQLESAISESERQVAAVQQRAAEAIGKAEAAAAKGGAEVVAGSVERETAMHRSLTDLRAELEVILSQHNISVNTKKLTWVC